MVECIGNEEQIVQLCVADRDCKKLADILVKPSRPVVDYRTPVHGITAQDLNRAAYCTQKDAQDNLVELLTPGTILVGHTLSHDLENIDETLVTEAEDSGYVYHVAEAFYTPMHASCEFLSALNAIPNVWMHFFSSGRECRNIPLVKQIMEGCYLKCSYDTFSMSHMTKESGSWDYKKKLENLGFELPWTIMVDDESPDVAATGEEINFLQLYYFGQTEHPRDRQVLRLRRENSLIRALGLIIWALELSTTANCTLVQALVAIQWDQHGSSDATVYPWSELEMDDHAKAHQKFWRIGFGKQKLDRLMMHRLQLNVSLPAVQTRDVEDLCIDALYCQ
ncbi:hypothetical protein SELMODRAFT_420963 [Selaginella moellendorffii]|uniref:Exonuclease domain-containing protein n=1 Tax=Selaginella moellendorffii TaxID=88036 RepID=D8SDP5_SELML|nr:hypothetical protein SELMODRAFT_420963 [Selaginella moellendorffii]